MQQQQAVSGESFELSDGGGVWSSCSMAAEVAVATAAVEVTSGGEAAPPSFIKRPSAQCLVEGGSVVFQCQVAGNPRPHIIWKKSGVPLTTGYRYTPGNSRHHHWRGVVGSLCKGNWKTHVNLI